MWVVNLIFINLGKCFFNKFVIVKVVNVGIKVLFWSLV